MYLLKILTNLGLFILFINLVLYSIGFAKNGKAYKFFVVYIISLFLINVITEIYAILNINNHFLATYYLFCPFLLLSFFYYYLFARVNKKKQLFIKFSAGIFAALLAMQYMVDPGQYFKFNSIGLLVTNCLVSVYAVLYLFELLSGKLPFQYATIGICIYFISSALIFASATSIVSFNVEISMFIWKINASLFIVYQLLILWEWKQTFYLTQKKQG
ncbi:hypothetical protein AMR72_00475 [Flavobacterium psychrophilum]|nr:hypothetical protein AMR72_00475 [Flavobacterium psychrophilum]AOE51123.1 hypothetical protein ALW18_00475 [Flavobacterium psychrophilum]